jgi:serine protease Do
MIPDRRLPDSRIGLVLLLEINRQPVQDAQDAVRLTEHVKDKTTLLKVWSRGASHYVVVDEEKAG